MIPVFWFKNKRANILEEDNEDEKDGLFTEH